MLFLGMQPNLIQIPRVTHLCPGKELRVVPNDSGSPVRLPLVVVLLSVSFSAPRFTSESESRPGRWRRVLCLALPDLTREASWPPTVHYRGGPAGVGMNSGIETRGL